MSVESVKQYFKQYGIENKVIEFDVSSATVELAAKALNTDEKRIAKTISGKIDEEAILIVVAGDVKIDNRKYKDEFKKKFKMLQGEEVQEKIGHKIGGVCPFAIKDGVKVYLDMSLQRFDTVFPACGSSNSAIELTIEELERYSNYEKWIDVCSTIV